VQVQVHGERRTVEKIVEGFRVVEIPEVQVVEIVEGVRRGAVEKVVEIL